MPAQTTRPPGRTHFKAAGTSAPTGANRIAPSSHSPGRSEEHTSELQSQSNLVCRLLLEKKKNRIAQHINHVTNLSRDFRNLVADAGQVSIALAFIVTIHATSCGLRGCCPTLHAERRIDT